MPNPQTGSIVGFVVACALVAGASPGRITAGAVQSSTRTVYVSAIDNKGSAVPDLQPAEFDVRLGGKKLEVAAAETAQAPLRIAVIVSDAGTGGFQQGIANFMQKLLGHAEVALISVIAQPETVVDYSSEGGVLREGVRRVGPRGRQRGGQLMEAIQDATRTVVREGTRPVILVLRVGAEATTLLSADDVREGLRKSGAILFVVSTLGAERAAPSSARQGISAEQAQLHDSEIADGAMNLAQVLGDGSKESGGRHEQVISTTLVPALDRVANELLYQYALKCVVPEGVKPSDKLSISSKRKGVKLHAPTRLRNWP